MKGTFLIGAWGAVVACGFCLTMKWSMTPGQAVVPARPQEQAAHEKIEAVFHPLCPCSTASLNLLKRALETTKGQQDVTLYFVGSVTQSKNIELAKTIPGANVVLISEAEATSRFGNTTSGQLLLWENGRLALSGGITDARGEEAPGAAYKTFISTLGSAPKKTIELPVYGCPVRS